MDPCGGERAVQRCGRVLLAVAANEIIIGGLSRHSSSTAAWRSGWLFDGGAAAAVVAVVVTALTVGGCIPPLGDRRRRGCESNGERGRAREGGRGRTNARGMKAMEDEEEVEKG